MPTLHRSASGPYSCAQSRPGLLANYSRPAKQPLVTLANLANGKQVLGKAVLQSAFFPRHSQIDQNILGRKLSRAYAGYVYPKPSSMAHLQHHLGRHVHGRAAARPELAILRPVPGAAHAQLDEGQPSAHHSCTKGSHQHATIIQRVAISTPQLFQKVAIGTPQ